MRLIGHLANEVSARTFGDFLLVQGIENRVEFEKDGAWAIWINDEDRITQAATILTAFRQNPNDPKYLTLARNAADIRAEKEKTDAAYRKRVRDGSKIFRPLTAYGFGPLTLVLIIASVVVFILSKFGNELEPIAGLLITTHLRSGLPEVMNGQVWRLITPIFIHFGALHILFNMLWLRDLGSMIEGRQSTWYFGILVLAIAIGSNVAQFIMSGPIFGGMSGVVYGLLGYVWLRGKFDPASGLFLHQSTVVMMMVWFVAGYSGLLGNIANTAHAAGLVMGMAWGYLSSLGKR